MQCYLKKVYLQIVLQFLFYYFEVLGSITVLDKGVTPLEKDSVGIQFFIDVENTDRISACRISTSAKECCLTEGDCNSMQVFGGVYTLKPRDTETLVFIYPSLYQHDQVGYCDFVLDYQCGRKRRSKKEVINIHFDTKVSGDRKRSNFLTHYIDDRRKTSCDTFDRDSLNNCEPVNCDFKYGGERSFFDYETGKCTEVALCESDLDEELPDIVYVPSINECRDLEHPLTVSDIYAISTGTGVVKRQSSEEEVKLELKSNCSTISQNINFLRDLMRGNLCPVQRTDTSDFSRCTKIALLSILSYIIGICGIVLSFICCIHTLLWLHKRITSDDLCNFCRCIKGKLIRSACSAKEYDVVNSEVRNNLLRDVIVKDIPMELRESIVDICGRMDRHVKKKKRYRRADVGSQISLSKVEYDVLTSTATSSTVTLDGSPETGK